MRLHARYFDVLFCVWLFLAGTGPVQAAVATAAPAPAVLPAPQNAVHVGADTSIVPLGQFIEYAQAEAGDRVPDGVDFTSYQWQQNATSAINLGYQSAPFWFRLHLTTGPQLRRDWILEVGNAQIDDIRTFLYENGRLIRSWHTGDQFPFHAREGNSANFLFPVQLDPDREYQLYFLVRNTEAMEMPVMLLPQAEYAAFSTRRALIDGLFYGIMLIMAAYSFTLYLTLLDRTYLYYVAYVTSMLVFFLWQQGILYQYLFPAYPVLQHFSAALISMLVFGSIAFFFRQFLQLREQVPRVWFVYRMLLVLHAVYCLLLAVLDYQTVITLMVINTVLSTVVAAAAIVHLALKGSRSAQIVLMGWALFLFCLMFFTAAKTGVVYNEFMASYGLRLGISVEILIFSFALSFRINQARKEKEMALTEVSLERNERIRAQELALLREIEANQAKEAALQMEKKHSESLQRQVEERTAVLESTLLNLEQANQELEKLSTLDGLTGIFNRRMFDEKLEESWSRLQRQGCPISILLIDIDHFKQINDQHGHQCGDYVLREFAALLKNLLHRPTDIITRYGGEEFAIILCDTPLTGAEVVADSIVRKAESHVYSWEGRAFHVTVSIGIEFRVAAADEQADALVANADAALYQAKQQGRNRWVSHGKSRPGANISGSN